MILPKHPRLMSDEELFVWARSLIAIRAPESSELDYKAAISIEGNAKRIELGKDVSSFANERGGVLLYGVPETEENDVPTPKDLSECGIVIPTDLPEDIENIMVNIVRPPLPELFIKVLNLEEIKPKSLLMIYHPESWNYPHMVEGYKDARYYRRGNFRAIVMNEREVEAAYLSRKASLEYADNFFKSGDFRALPKEGQFFRVVLCPHFALIRRQEMHENEFKEWLDQNPPAGRRGDWVPFLDGWSFLGYPQGDFHGRLFEYRLFHNGGFSFTLDVSSMVDSKGRIVLDYVERYLSEYIFDYASKFFETLRITGPLSMQFSLHNVRGFNAAFLETHVLLEPYIGVFPLEKDSLGFVEETSVSETQLYKDNVVKRVIVRLAAAFGIYKR